MGAKTYAKIPAVGSSHLHFMNNIPCHVSLQLSNDTGLVHEEAMDALENLVLRDLDPGQYSLDMEVSSTCLPELLARMLFPQFLTVMTILRKMTVQMVV